MRVVIDTNVFVSSFFGGKPFQIIEKWISGDITLCVSSSILKEYIEVLNRFDFERKDLIFKLMEMFKAANNVLFISDPPEQDWVKADPADNKFIACAISLGAEFIISGDHHLRSLKRIGKIKILSPSEFLKIIEHKRE